MNIDRRRLAALPALAIGLLGAVPALAASADEEAVSKKVEAFRAAQVAADAKARRAAAHPDRPGEACRAAPGTWEPRIDVLDVYAAPDPARPNVLVIEINYQVRSTNSRFNLVYPFYLE